MECLLFQIMLIPFFLSLHLKVIMSMNSLLVFFFIFMFLVAIVQVHIFEIAFVKLGLTPEEATLIVLGTILGSIINLPIYSVTATINNPLVVLAGRKLIWKTWQKKRHFSHGRTRNFTEKDRNRDTEKTDRRKGILATEGHGISRNKTEAETRKRRRKGSLATE